MKSSNDKRQASIKKYDERVQLVRMDNSKGDTHFHYVIYNYDCKLYVKAYLNCKWNDGGEVQWSIVMEPTLDNVARLYKSTLDMWNSYAHRSIIIRSLYDLSIDYMLHKRTEISINRKDYANNPLMLEQQLRQVVKRTYGNRWLDETESSNIKKYNEIVSKNSLVESRAKTSWDILNSGLVNGCVKFYHECRLDHLHTLLGICHNTRCMDRQHELYLEEMEQEDINTSIRMLF